MSTLLVIVIASFGSNRGQKTEPYPKMRTTSAAHSSVFMVDEIKGSGQKRWESTPAPMADPRNELLHCELNFSHAAFAQPENFGAGFADIGNRQERGPPVSARC
ncbi:MAG: hypothetical protein JWL59_4383 [Chthoniobacteraceae bacterium]|nr:hypothetical protein [Chthoniobacteraceae bacterium]